MASFQGLLILCLVLFICISAGATQFKVGGSNGWSVPTDSNDYLQWAQKNRFQIGDSLLFVYPPDTDSVLVVNETSYHNCDTSSPINTFNDGNTVFVFTRSGPFYFITGNKDNCLKNESLVVVVMADRTKGSSAAPSPSPTSAASPPPPASMEFSPASPSFPHGEGSNSASSMVASLMSGLLGPFIGSLLLLVL